MSPFYIMNRLLFVFEIIIGILVIIVFLEIFSPQFQSWDLCRHKSQYIIWYIWLHVHRSVTPNLGSMVQYVSEQWLGYYVNHRSRSRDWGPM